MRHNHKSGAAAKAGKRADIRSIVRIDNPDDAEIAAPPGEGDSDTLVRIDSPDDAEIFRSRRAHKNSNKNRK